MKHTPVKLNANCWLYRDVEFMNNAELKNREGKYSTRTKDFNTIREVCNYVDKIYACGLDINTHT